MLITFTPDHLAAAAARALTGHARAAMVVEGIGALQCDVVARVIAAIRPALLAGDPSGAVVAAANALPGRAPHTEPVAGRIRTRHASSFVTWFAELAARAAVDDMLRDVIAVRDQHEAQLFRLTAAGTPYTATLRPGGLISPWLIDTFAGDVLVSRCEVYRDEVADARIVAEAGLRALAGIPDASTATPREQNEGVNTIYAIIEPGSGDVLAFADGAQADRLAHTLNVELHVVCVLDCAAGAARLADEIAADPRNPGVTARVAPF